MNVLRLLCTLSVLFGIVVTSVFAQQAPIRQVPGLAGHSCDALLAENTRLTNQVEVLKQRVELLKGRIRTLESSR